MEHKIKIQKEYFEEVLKGNKKAELRFNDRDYKVGDIYLLQEIDENGAYTGRQETICITHILQGFGGLQEGWCMFSFERVHYIENKNTNKLLDLASQYPDYPIVPMVNGELCCDDSYAYWQGAIGNCYASEYVVREYGDGYKFYSRDEQDEIEEKLYDDICDNEEYEELSVEEIEKIVHEKVEALPWKKAIILYITLPDPEVE